MKKTKRPVSSIVLILLMLFQALSAIPTGFCMTMDPSGAGIGLPNYLLEQSPFSNFLIPGLFLGIVLGVFPVIILYGLITRKDFWKLNRINLYKKHHWALGYSYYLGILLIVWINMQLYFGIGFHILHFVYSILGLLIIVFSQLPGVKRYYLIA